MREAWDGAGHRPAVNAIERNRYFEGKLLTAYHFDLETNYHNSKRWLVNRLVLGYGVVCGLDVKPGPRTDTVIIAPGFAIDKWGREIVVPRESQPIQIPESVIRDAGEYEPKGQDGYEESETSDAREQTERWRNTPDEHRYEPEGRDRTCVEIRLCYHECETDPVPVMAGDCNSADLCAAGAIREKWRLEFSAECTRPQHDRCRIDHIVSGGRIDYGALAEWVTRERRDCLDLPQNPCIRLAHVYLSGDEGHRHDPANIDITVRSIVYSNDLLFDILLGWRSESQGRRDK